MQQVKQWLVLDHVVLVEPGDDPAHVVAAVGVVRSDLSRKEAAGERAERDEPDAELFTDWDDVLLEHPLHDRVLALDCGDRSHGVRPADLLDGGLRLSPATDRALRDQLAHHRGNVLDGDGWRYPVLVEQLNVLGPQTRQ